MDRTQLVASIYHAVGQVTTEWGGKLAASCVMGLAISTHVQLLALFMALVIIDLLTKWAELAKMYLTDSGATDTSIWEVICAFNRARKAGYIKSDIMKHRFLGKICVYMIFTFGAAILDSLFKTLDKPEFAVVLTVGYLAVTEFLSILENLQGAGVEEAEKLSDLIERKGNLK